MEKPLEKPPELEEGDDSVNATDDVETVTIVDFEQADRLDDDDDVTDDEVDGDEA